MFVEDPDQLLDPLPLPYRWLVSLASEVVKNVEDHIDRLVALERVQDRERGLQIHTSIILDEPLGTAYLPGISGFSDGSVALNDGSRIQIFDQVPVQFLKSPKIAPTFVFNADAPREFRQQPMPSLVLAGSSNALVLLANGRVCSEVLQFDRAFSDVFALGVQGGLVAAVRIENVLKLLLVELPSPKISDAELAEMWKADRERITPWNITSVRKFAEIASFAISETAFDEDAGVFWFTSEDRQSLNAVDCEVLLEPPRPNTVLRGVSVNRKLPTHSFAPLKITAIAAATYQVLLGFQSGAVALLTRGLPIPLQPLPGHYAAVNAVALVSGRAVTFSQDGYLHLYDLSSGAVLLRCASYYPQAPSAAAAVRIVGTLGDLFLYATSTDYRVIDVQGAKKICGFSTGLPVIVINGNLFASVEGQLRKIKAIGSFTVPTFSAAATPEVSLPEVPAWVDLEWSGIRHLKLAVAQIIAEAAAEVGDEIGKGKIVARS